METREIKALEIAARMRVVREGGAWSVPSQTGPGTYKVDPALPSCTCEDFGLRREPCKHVLAVRIVMDREAGVIPPAEAPEPNAKPYTRRPTYPQQWSAYNRAQHAEKHRFQVLLAELCRGVTGPPRAKTGRKPVPLADALFSMAFKVYSGFSSRRFGGDLSGATAAGHMSRPLHPNKVNTFMENPGLNPIERDLLEKLLTAQVLTLAGVMRLEELNRSGAKGNDQLVAAANAVSHQQAWVIQLLTGKN